MADKEANLDKKKSHRPRHSGVKAKKKHAKTKSHDEELSAKQRNPKAFAINSTIRAERQFRRKEDITAKKQHIPLVDKTPDEPPPVLIAIVGPPKVGKSTLVNNLIKNFTRTNVTNISGPITIVTSKRRRITLIECNNDVNSMVDIAKCADLVLLLCDASYGFEMEIFEFLNICQVHGMPKIMGVLTHLDMIKNPKTLKKRKKELKHRFWTEVYDGAKLFYLSGILHGEYLRNEIKNLGRFISVIKFRPLTWRESHSYILVDRVEDITNSEKIRLNKKCDRQVVLYGYVRGVAIKDNTMVHIAGLGDFRISELNVLTDPCPLPGTEKKRNLLEKERLLYAPMSGVGGIVYDKDAVYIELQGSHSHKDYSSNDPEKDNLISKLKEKKQTIDTQIDEQVFKLFSDGGTIKSKDFVENEPVAFGDDDEDVSLTESSNDSSIEKDSCAEEESEKLVWDNEKEEQFQESEVSSNEEYQDANKEFNNENEDQNIKLNMAWKENMICKAAEAYLERQSNSQNLMKIVYGTNNKVGKSREITEENPTIEDNNYEIGGLFKLVNQQLEQQKIKHDLDQEENCFFEKYLERIRDWTIPENKELILNCFVTGKWKESDDAEELLKLDDMSDGDSEIYGDFEDLETGETHESKFNQAQNDNKSEDLKNNNAEKRKITRVEEANMTKSELMAKKMKLKAKFDSEYDNQAESRITGDHEYYESLKAAAGKQSELNKKAFADLDNNLRIQIEGFRAGLYVRMCFEAISPEFIENLDTNYPILVGGLNNTEENIGFVNCKIKKHRWYKKTLKTGDPLIISLGWRRFQTIPIFSNVEDNLKHRYLKYTPNHITCSMTFWGPITPQNTGLLALQDVNDDRNYLKALGFRIAATGCVTEVGKSTQIMKKLKLVGTPLKIYKKTAFIKGMFNSALEVARFEGAKIKTVSGIRGQIKRVHSNPEGSFRATFEDKILLSDIVFCRTWFNVDVPKFYAPITSLLLPAEEKTKWRGMKTLGQLKRERNIKMQPNIDSMYTEVKRQPKIFRPLVIPKSLQKALPYKDKPKHGPINNKATLEASRVAVIRSPHEQKVARMLNMIKTNYDDKKERDKKQTEIRLANFRKQKEADELRKLKKQKELKKKVSRALSKINRSKSNN